MVLSTANFTDEGVFCAMVRVGGPVCAGGSVEIRVNDDIGHYFQTLKGLRQGDPLSPILFNLVVDMLAILISRAKEDGQVGGLVPHLVEGGGGSPSFNMRTILFFS